MVGCNLVYRSGADVRKEEMEHCWFSVRPAGGLAQWEHHNQIAGGQHDGVRYGV